MSYGHMQKMQKEMRKSVLLLCVLHSARDATKCSLREWVPAMRLYGKAVFIRVTAEFSLP